MIRNPKAFAILLLLAICSLTLKAYFSRGVDYVAQWPLFRTAVTAELGRAGFEVTPFLNGEVVAARRDDCIIYLYPSRPEGGDEPLRNQQLGSLGTLVFWYGNAIYDHRPVVMPLFRRNLDRILAAVGFTRKYYPVYGIYTSGQCSFDLLAALPLDRVQTDGAPAAPAN